MTSFQSSVALSLEDLNSALVHSKCNKLGDSVGCILLAASDVDRSAQHPVVKVD